MRYIFDMAKIDDIYEAVDDFGLITSAEASELGMSRAEVVQQAEMGKLVRVARGVYRMPIWPSQPQAPYAVAVKAAGEGAFLCGESVVALLGLAPTDPTRIRLASPKRCRRDLGPGVTVERMGGVKPVFLEGVACQPVPSAIVTASRTMGASRALQAAHEALTRGYITQDEVDWITKELSQ